MDCYILIRSSYLFGACPLHSHSSYSFLDKTLFPLHCLPSSNPSHHVQPIILRVLSIKTLITKMAISAANSHIRHLELCRRDCRQPEVASSSVGIPGGGFSVAKAGAWRRAGRGRGEMKVAAFWQDSRPTFIEMASIAGVEELDQLLSRAQEHSEVVIIDWMAAWCRKCIYLKPKLEKLAAEFYPRIKFYFVDVNKVPQSLVKRGNISKMPTIQLWKDGECKAEIIGGHQAWLVMDEVREMIQKHK